MNSDENYGTVLDLWEKPLPVIYQLLIYDRSPRVGDFLLSLSSLAFLPDYYIFTFLTNVGHSHQSNGVSPFLPRLLYQ